MLSPRATRLPTQPSANTTLGIESRAQLVSFWMISFPFLIHHRRPALGISRRHAETIHRLVCTRQTLAPPRTAFDRGLLCLADSPTFRCKPMTSFPNLKAGSRGACAFSITLLSADYTPCDRSPGSTPFSVDICVFLPSPPSPTLTSLRTILTPFAARLARRRARVHPAARRGVHVRRGPHLRCIAFHATQDCTDSGCARRRC
ncbi:hypothetical protein B0H14DRAFT_1310683 [Mycena olivaceomarginata]|nr:hypothetical protein B0H14DRAFT_1310683 [Mycena olivaceomarginata]